MKIFCLTIAVSVIVSAATAVVISRSAGHSAPYRYTSWHGFPVRIDNQTGEARVLLTTEEHLNFEWSQPAGQAPPPERTPTALPPPAEGHETD